MISATWIRPCHWLLGLFAGFLWLTARGDAPDFQFTSVSEGQAQLRQKDEFTRHLSTFDRSARLQTDAPVSEKQFLKFIGDQVLVWDDESRQSVEAALKELRPQLAVFRLPWPKTIRLIRTTGREEGHAAYTRGTCVILPERLLKSTPGGLADILAHECFHVLSRANPSLRRQLYGAIGFKKCAEIRFPPAMAARRITNPDAPVFDQAITVQAQGRTQRVVPVLHATVEHYPAGAKREFFDYLHFGFWPLDATSSSRTKMPELLEVGQLGGFDEQVGKNTGYIIHPEEIMADNFKMLIRRSKPVPSPDVLARVEKILRENTRTTAEVH